MWLKNKQHMGNAAGQLLAAQILTFLGFLFPIGPIVGSFLLEGVSSWLGWVFVAILLLWIIVPSVTVVSADTENKAQGALASWGALVLIYLGFLIYACVHVMRDFRISSTGQLIKGKGASLPTSPLPSPTLSAA